MGMDQNTYENTILSGMNIHKSQLWIDVNYRGTIGFDTLPYLWGEVTNIRVERQEKLATLLQPFLIRCIENLDHRTCGKKMYTQSKIEEAVQWQSKRREDFGDYQDIWDIPSGNLT